MTCPLGLGSLVYKKKKKCSYLSSKAPVTRHTPSKQLAWVLRNWEMG